MNTHFNKRLGNTIRAIRQMRGLTQEQLAERVGLDKSYLGRLENGRRTTTLETIKRIADALNVNYAVLLLFTEIDDPHLGEFTTATFEHVWKGFRKPIEVVLNNGDSEIVTKWVQKA